MVNKLAWKFTNDFEETTAVSEGDGHQALAFFETVPIGCGWRVVGWETVLLERVFKRTWFWYIFFLFILRGYIFRTRVRFGLLVVSPQSVIFQSFRWLWPSSIQPLGDGVVGSGVGRRGCLKLLSVCWLWITWT